MNLHHRFSVALLNLESGKVLIPIIAKYSAEKWNSHFAILTSSEDLT